jgi:AcrR family transcriptional regulator
MSVSLLQSQSVVDIKKPPGQNRPGGRTERSRIAVAEAVLAFLHRGVGDFSVDDIAEASGIHRTTIYRRWPTRALLVEEALTLHKVAIKYPDSGSWQKDIKLLAREMASFALEPLEITCTAIVVSEPKSAISKVLTDHWGPIMVKIREVMQRGVDRGEVRKDINMDVMVDHLTCPFMVRAAVTHVAIDDTFINGVADAVIHAGKAGP